MAGILVHDRGSVGACGGREPTVPAGGTTQSGRTLAAYPDRDARTLEGERRQGNVVDVVVLPVVHYRLARPEPVQDREPLVEHCGTLFRSARLTEGGKLLRHPPEPSPEDHPSTAKEIQASQGVCHYLRAAACQRGNGGSQLETGGGDRDGG